MSTSHDGEWEQMLAECGRVIEESADILEEIECQVTGRDELSPAQLHQLYDMAEDAAESGRIRRAESNLAWRRAA